MDPLLFKKKIIGPFKNFVFVFIWYDPGMIEKALDVIYIVGVDERTNGRTDEGVSRGLADLKKGQKSRERKQQTRRE